MKNKKKNILIDPEVKITRKKKEPSLFNTKVTDDRVSLSKISI